MARMSHDDSVGRDPRFDHLAMLVGWSKRETVGCLQLDVWPICYDRIAPYLTVLDVDLAANRSAISPVKHQGGFAAAMVEAGLARPATKADTTFTWRPKGWKEGDSEYSVSWPDQEWKGKLYLNGTAERIAYLMRSKVAGAHGGRKSAETRAKRNQPPYQPPLDPPTKGPTRGASWGVEGSTNLPDTPTPPDSASPPVTDTLVPAREKSPPAAGTKGKPKLTPVPPQEALDAAQRLLDRIIANQPGCSHARAGLKRQRETVTRWADAMRLLNERDGRSWDEILAMVDWCQDDNFWRSNILSGDKLREKWDQLEAKRNRTIPTRDVRVGRVEPRPAEDYPDGDLTHLL